MPASTSPTPVGTGRAWCMLALAVLAIFSALGLGRFGYGMVLPEMQRQLHLSNAQTGVLQSWNLLGYMLTVGVTGALATHLGPRRVIAAALLVVALAMTATGLAGSYAHVCLARFLTGVGGAAANVPAMALVAGWFAAPRRGLASGIAVTGSSLGLVVTGPLVPFLLRTFGENGWRAAWLVFGALALFVCVLCTLFLQNRPDNAGQAASADSARPPDRARWRDVYASGRLWHLAAVYFTFGFSYIIYSTFFVKHLVKTAGMSTGEAGHVWLLVGLASGASGLLWGVLSDRLGRRCALVLIFLVQGVAFLLCGWTGERTGLLISAGLFALTAWSIPAIVAALSADLFGARLAPAALGLVTVVFGLGQVLGPWLAGGLADRCQSFGPAFVVAGIAAVAGAAGAQFLRTGDRR